VAADAPEIELLTLPVIMHARTTVVNLGGEAVRACMITGMRPPTNLRAGPLSLSTRVSRAQMSSSLGLDRYHAGLIAVVCLADPVAPAADDLPGSHVLDDTRCVQVLAPAEELAKVPDSRAAAGRRFDLVFLLLVRLDGDAGDDAFGR
jgi:hypothetical protein